MKKISMVVVAALTGACRMETEGIGSPGSDSSSSSSGDESIEDDDGEASTTEIPDPETSGSTTTDAESSSTDTSESSGDESSTGVEAKNFALSFDGGRAISAATNLVAFDGDPYTIEMWILADDDMEGVLFDTTVTTLNNGNGVTLVRDENWTESEEVVFYDFGVSPPLWLAGPDLSALAPQWHHLAFVHTGSDLTLWIDGSMAGTKPATTDANNADAPICLGTQPTTPFVSLRGVMIDELKISPSIRYVEPFVPEPSLGTEDAMLYWTFDEGEGDGSFDLITGLELGFVGGVDWAAVD